MDKVTEVHQLAFHRADIAGAIDGAVLPTLIDVETIGIVAVIDRGTAGERDVCLGGTAIIAERREHDVNIITAWAKVAGVVRR